MLQKHPAPIELLPYLEQYPTKALAQCYILRHIDDDMELIDKGEALVDRLDSPGIIILKSNNRASRLVFAQTLDDFTRYLEYEDPRGIFFPALDASFAAHLRANYKLTFDNQAQLFVVSEEWQPSTLPQIKTEPIRDDDVPMVTKLWPYSDNEEYIRWRIQTAPSVAIYYENTLAAYVIVHGDGSMGALQVMDEYRGKGLAKLVSAHLIEMIRQLGDTPWCAVVEDNIASLNLCRSLGYEHVGDASWLFVDKQENEE